MEFENHHKSTKGPKEYRDWMVWMLFEDRTIQGHEHEVDYVLIQSSARGLLMLSSSSIDLQFGFGSIVFGT